MKKMGSQSGFTLIELIMVIVILGVLSAAALPRFADIGNDARAASLKGALGSVRAAAAIAHAESLASGALPGGSVTLEGTVVAMANNYPTAAAGGITAAAQINSLADYTVTYAAGVATIQVTGAAAPATCQFTYTQAAGPGLAPTISAPNTNGC